MTTQRWELLADHIAEVEHLVARFAPAPMVRSALDQEGAELRDWLDEAGISVTDPEALYVGLTFLALVDRLGQRYAFVHGSPDALVARALRNGIVADLLEYVPVEVRR